MIASIRIGQGQQGKGYRRIIRNWPLEALILLIIFGALFASHALAQSTGQGIISGIVTDSTGASVNHAAVTIRNTETNVSINAVTNDTGYYEVRDLNQGPYEVSAAAPGFERLIRSGIILLAEGHPSIDLELKIGNSSQSIVVNGQLPWLTPRQCRSAR
jgi:hypothetical protein